MYTLSIFIEKGVVIIRRKKEQYTKIRPKYRLNPRKSHAQFKKDLGKKNPNVEVLEPYRDGKTPILFRCKICEKEFRDLPKYVLHLNGCPDCGYKRMKEHSASTRKTNEQFLEEMKQYPTITPLQPYQGARTKIKVQCNVCNTIWEGVPTNLLRSEGCPNCGRLTRAKTHEQYVEEAARINPTIEILGIYTGSTNPIEVRCKECGRIWSPKAQQVLSGHRCTICAHRALCIPADEFKARVKSFGTDITYLDDYVDTTTHIKVQCNKCGYIWDAWPAGLLQGAGCYQCGITQRTRTHEEYLQELHQCNPDITCLGEYKNAVTPILHRCNICGHEWNVVPNSLLHGYGCPRCSQKRIGLQNRLSNEEFQQRITEIHEGNIACSDSYQGQTVPLNFHCNKCGHDWVTPPVYIMNGHGCPNCSFVRSRGEIRINKYLQSYQIPFEPQKRFSDLHGLGGRYLSYDFYLPTYNLLIEFNGLQHYQQVDYFGAEDGWMIRQEHDRRKTQYAKDNGIELLTIRYDEDVNQVLDKYFSNHNILNSESQETVRVS